MFAEGDDYLAVDDFTGEILTLRGYRTYAATWEPIMAAFAQWNIAVVDDIDVKIFGDTAVSYFKFKGIGTLKDDSTVTGYTYSTLIWHRVDGNWRLVHEHLTSGST